MKKVYGNLYIDTFKNFDASVNGELNDFIKNKIKLVINLTECAQLDASQRIALICNKIKAFDLFNDPELVRIKQIPPNDRTAEEVNSRSIIREKRVKELSQYILDLSKVEENILFVCNKNNVLSQLFVLIILKLRGKDDVVKDILEDSNIVTTIKNRNDIEKYLEKYISIIYNEVNEVS